MKKVLLYGYIGHENFGDDLLFKIAVERFQKLNSEFEISVVNTNLKENPEYLKKYFSKLKIIKIDGGLPFTFFSQFDIVFYIGGGVFFDYAEKINLISFYKRYAGNFIRYGISKLNRTRFGGIGIGIGPYYTKRGFRLHKQVLGNFQFLGVRDESSKNTADKMGVRNVYLTNDLSIGHTIDIPKNETSSEIVFCPRSYRHKPEFEKHINTLLKYANVLSDKNHNVRWVFLQKDNSDIMERLTGYQVTIWDPNKMLIDDFINIFRKARVVFSSRMHSLFIAGLVKTPFVAIVIHPKLKFASELFYAKNAILLNPTDDLDKYQEAYEKLDKIEFDFSLLEQEQDKLNVIDALLEEWIK